MTDEEVVAPLQAAEAATGGDHPSNDPIGTVREVQNHVYVKLANPADEPWHIVWCHGEQFMSGWQSDEDMVGSTKWDGYLPVRECGAEGKSYVSWEHWLATKKELDEAQRQARVWKNLYTAAAASRDELVAEFNDLFTPMQAKQFDALWRALNEGDQKDAAQPPTSEASPQ